MTAQRSETMTLRCEAVTENYRRRSRCTAKAVGRFERTRTVYTSVANYDKGIWERIPSTETVQLGQLCRRHANQFGATPKVA